MAGIGNGQGGAGPSGGNITIAAGGNIFSTATGTGGNARIATTFGLGADSIINVTAAGQIGLATNPDADGTTTGGLALIANFLNEAGAT